MEKEPRLLHQCESRLPRQLERLLRQLERLLRQLERFLRQERPLRQRDK